MTTEHARAYAILLCQRQKALTNYTVGVHHWKKETSRAEKTGTPRAINDSAASSSLVSFAVCLSIQHALSGVPIASLSIIHAGKTLSFKEITFMHSLTSTVYIPCRGQKKRKKRNYHYFYESFFPHPTGFISTDSGEKKSLEGVFKHHRVGHASTK